MKSAAKPSKSSAAGSQSRGVTPRARRVPPAAAPVISGESVAKPWAPGALEQSLPADWRKVLRGPETTAALHEAEVFLNSRAGTAVFPRRDEIFAALRLTPFAQVRVVILGQDPYHGPGQAHGLAFSVPGSQKLPPSLRNIFKLVQLDTNAPVPARGDLTIWARQGVLLLNTVLTVSAHAAASHAGHGWEAFTNHVIDVLNRDKVGLVFVLWGSHAQRKLERIDTAKHLVLQSVHPSPLSAHRGFFDAANRPFSRINAHLQARGEDPVDWHLPAE